MADSSAAELFPWFDFNGKGLFSKAFKPVFNLEQWGSPKIRHLSTSVGITDMSKCFSESKLKFENAYPTTENSMAASAIAIG